MVSKILKGLGALIAVLVLAVGAFYGWAVSTTGGLRAQVFDVHTVELPVPFPLTETEVADLRAKRLAEMVAAAAATAPTDGGVALASGGDAGSADAGVDPLAGVDLNAIALENALARGKHLVDARYGCAICHGADFSGGNMFDSPVIGTAKGLNLTRGKGSVTVDFKSSDWERAIRHGIRPDGTPMVMPSVDYAFMSDQELSDVVAYIQSQPPVDNEVPLPVFGPLFNVLLATGKIHFSAVDFASNTTHVALPPPAGPTAEFGEHLSKTCTGCHGMDFAGGPIEGGDPAWPPASNLTPEALKSWTFEQFEKTLLSGVRPNGEPLKMPMTETLPMLNQTTAEERQALWAYFQTVPAKPTRQ